MNIFTDIHALSELHAGDYLEKFLGCSNKICILQVDLVQFRLRRKVGRDGLGAFAVFQMLLAKLA